MAKNAESKSFEQAMGELEKIVQAVESGQVPLAEALAQYEKGIELISHCQNILSQAEQKIAKLSKGLDGELKVEEKTPGT
ncbi:MAG: exodeoxyribonuclease VII small subunit [Actinobacteria bacterium]|nr:exodeoxyribonuclease VII small subunit [Actinomycetota bacterium]